MNSKLFNSYCLIIPVIVCMGLIFLVVLSGCAYSQEIDYKTAIHCILGEARGEGYKGMVAVGEALRNRGTVKGVYGCRADFKEPKWVWDLAEKAWRESVKTNLVKGSDHWVGTKRDGEWIAKMEKTMTFKVQIANQRFYLN